MGDIQQIQDKRKIEELQEQFETVWKDNSDESFDVKITQVPEEKKAYYNKTQNIWMASYPEKRHFANALGIKNGEKKENCLEINFSFDGDKRSNGILAEKNGSIFMLHSGNVNINLKGNDRKKIDIKNFESAHNFETCIIDGKSYIIIGNLVDKNIIDNVSKYAKIVKNIKDGAREGKTIEIKNEIDEDHTEKISQNTILFGPPGTGKTFFTKKRSIEILEVSL